MIQKRSIFVIFVVLCYCISAEADAAPGRGFAEKIRGKILQKRGEYEEGESNSHSSHSPHSSHSSHSSHSPHSYGYAQPYPNIPFGYYPGYHVPNPYEGGFGGVHRGSGFGSEYGEIHRPYGHIPGMGYGGVGHGR